TPRYRAAANTSSRCGNAIPDDTAAGSSRTPPISSPNAVVRKESRPSTGRRAASVRVPNIAPVTTANTTPPTLTGPGDQVSSTSPSTAPRIETQLAALGRRCSRTAVTNATNTGTVPMVTIVAMLTEVIDTATK